VYSKPVILASALVGCLSIAIYAASTGTQPEETGNAEGEAAFSRDLVPTTSQQENLTRIRKIEHRLAEVIGTLEQHGKTMDRLLELTVSQVGSPGLESLSMSDSEQQEDDTGARPTTGEQFDDIVFGEEVGTEEGDWADEAAQTLTTVIGGGHFETSRLEDVHCNANLCRLEVFHESQEASQEFDRVFPALVRWQSQISTTQKRLETGEIHSTVYYSRDGHLLPAVAGK
jgi:hypothetical protein